MKQQKDWFIVENGKLKHVFELHTQGGFLWRLWFLISAPIIWLIKGEIKIKYMIKLINVLLGSLMLIAFVAVIATDLIKKYIKNK